ncbi:unnamed protein product [Eruca vesicaria subsp. sativa]|uniref:Uncharacterized protein n=1 Tax=Eruca vesicaria subsp. sativa TaxID=29727 RepID=A0ABC8LT81_ERUVS|nr:unnamed protein product [Eruca vesicaria subsp. sativa]
MEGSGLGSGGGGRISSNGVVMKKEGLGFSTEGFRLENPFAFKALQVFTGFGVGCGVGIGSGAPLNLGSIPMVGEVMSAARGATTAFSGATHHVNDALRKMGARNIKAGVGCGVGFGHGFGVGIAVKPSAIHKLQASIMGTASSLMAKLGRTSETTTSQNEIDDQATQSLTEVKKHVETKASYKNSGSSNDPRPFGTRTEKVINSFLDNPILKQQETTTAEERQVTQLESESLMLQMVLKHQKLVNELMEENEKLRRIIIEDLKVSPEKLKSVSSYVYESPCKDCFECRRKQRKSR